MPEAARQDPEIGAAIDDAHAAVHAFVDAFNRSDQAAIADAFNFPHVRLAGGAFTSFADRADFLARRAPVNAALRDEGWHHTVLESIEVVHASRDKVHLSMRFTRHHVDGAVYADFPTLWIATRQSGHWGIQFRSSYLT